MPVDPDHAIQLIERDGMRGGQEGTVATLRSKMQFICVLIHKGFMLFFQFRYHFRIDLIEEHRMRGVPDKG